MTSRNIHVKGHSLVKLDPNDSRKASCMCGAWDRSLVFLSPPKRLVWRREWHDEHKINVLRSRGEWEEDDEGSRNT